MHCDQGNISIENIRVSANQTNVTHPLSFDMMTQINGSNSTRKLIPSLTIFSYNLSAENATNTTVWRLYANPTNKPGGLCNGTVVFTAENA